MKVFGFISQGHLEKAEEGIDGDRCLMFQQPGSYRQKHLSAVRASVSELQLANIWICFLPPLLK